MNEIEISIVMPCLNEAETLADCIREARAALEASGTAGEIVVADNGSTDGSREIAAQAGARVVEAAPRGYGHALQAGIRGARGRYVLMGDADGSYDFGELPRFLERLRTGHDLVMGCRFPRFGGRIEPGAMPWKHRWIGNPILSSLGKLFFGAPVNDFHCGLRAFRREAVLNLDLRTAGMEFASEMVAKASLRGLKFSEVPVTLRPDRRSRPPHLRSWRDGWRHLRFMLFFSPNWLFALPGLTLTLAGAFGFLLLLPRPLKVGSVTFDLNSLLVSAAAMTAGVQILAFGLFIKAYAVNIGLLPGRRYWRRIVEGPAVEWGIVIGFVLISLGVGFLSAAVLQWKSAGFGPLAFEESLRLTILAVTLIALGLQALFSGFVLNILGLKR